MFTHRLFTLFNTLTLDVRRTAKVLITAALLAILIIAALPAQPAFATYPGQNGRIAYGVFDRATGTFIRYTANPDGSHVQPLTNLAGFSNPDWSPDGTRIAIDFLDANGYAQIATVAPDGSNLQVLTSGSFVHEMPDWSPDGTQIVFDYSALDPNLPFSTALWVMNADGSNAHPLMTPELSGFDVEPRWQPTGGLITFARIRKWLRGIQQEAVFVVNGDGTNPVQLTSWGLAPEHPTWSPDGKVIIFNDASFEPFPIESIWTMKFDGTDRHVLYQGTQHASAVKPWFSPDGKKILFSCGTYGRAHTHTEDLCIMNADGTGIVKITDTPGVFENIPSWGTAPLQ